MPYFSICRLAKSMMLIMPSNICHVGFPEKMPHLTIILALFLSEFTIIVMQKYTLLRENAYLCAVNLKN